MSEKIVQLNEEVIKGQIKVSVLLCLSWRISQRALSQKWTDRRCAMTK